MGGSVSRVTTALATTNYSDAAQRLLQLEILRTSAREGMDSSVSELKAIIDAYGGDYDAAIERFMGDEDFYRQMLDMLAQDSSVVRLKDALDIHELDEAFSAAHELKGVAGNLGLTPLFESLDSIVEPLRSRTDQDYSDLFQKVQDAFDKACDLRYA